MDWRFFLCPEYGDTSLQMYIRNAITYSSHSCRLQSSRARRMARRTLGSSPRIGDFATVLLGQALLAEGASPPDPARFARLVTDLMVESLG